MLLPLLLPVLLAPVPATAAPQRGSETQAEARAREAEAEAALEDSSAAVRAAAASLASVAARLPAARAAVARTNGELAGARARVTAAEGQADRAEQARSRAESEVGAATAAVAQGRKQVGLLARRTYQNGRIGDLQQVFEAGDPQDVLERANLLRSVFRYQDSSLQRLGEDRLRLSGRRAGLAAQERTVQRARGVAQERAARAREVAVSAQRAEAAVQALLAQRAAALTVAQAERAQDVKDYAAAQAASKALAERIREAARKAAEAERRRVAAEKAADEAARKRAKAANQPPPPRRAPRRSPRTGTMQWPCDGCPLTSRFGWRTHPIYGDRRFHAGIDMGAPIGTPARAADGGTVTYAGYAQGYGTLVTVSHGVVNGRDLTTSYAHMGSIDVSVGQVVGRGQQVGGVGNEGNSTGPHLHFEVRIDGNPVDPLDYVDPP